MELNQKGAGNELKLAALEYARNGIPVFPLKPGDKTPIHNGGFHNATTDPETISRWWDEHPQANIGMPTGKASGVVVLDIDNKGTDGFAALATWRDKGFILPATRTVSTPNQGKHGYFNAPTVKIANRTGIVPGIDVRGDGGYVVLPPSRLANGKSYEWEGEGTPIADAPQWLLVLLVAKPPAKPILFEAETNTIPNGCRNDTLVRIAGSLRRHGADEEEVFQSLWNTNLHRCDPPLDEGEVRKIASSAMRWEPVPHEYPLTDSGNAEWFG
jgi:putative DNA primase/helicase